MNRRSFLQALGIGSSASALSACGLDNNQYFTPIEQSIPYVTRPEQIVPGTATYFATTVLSGPNAWPAVAVNREGRVINVGANHQAPLAPGVSRYAFFEVQRHYSPDRFRGPLDGGPTGQPIAWDAAMAKLTDAVKAARAEGKKVAYLGPYRSGALASLLDKVTGGEAIFWEPLGREAEARASELLFGRSVLPRYDLADARYVLSFGADFLGGLWGGQWTQAGYASARRPSDGFVARFALVSPHRDQSGANADDWYACAPGAQAAVARAVAALVAQKKGYSGPALAWLSGADAAAAASAAGLKPEDLEAMATTFAGGASIALPGGVAGASIAATELAAAVYLLNVVADAPGFSLGGYQAPVHRIERVEALVADMNAGNVAVLLLDDVVNPAFSLPASVGFAAAMAKVPLSVALSSHPDETAAGAKLVLPTNGPLEDWGHEEPLAGLHVLRQPGGIPLWDTRSLGELLLATWRALDPAAPTYSWREHIQAAVWATRSPVAPPPAPSDEPAGEPDASGRAGRRRQPPTEAAVVAPVAAPPTVPTPTALDLRWWESCLSAGFTLTDAFTQRVAPTLTGAPIAFAGASAAAAGELALHLYLHEFLADGRYANQPWAQEVPDPLTGQVWDTWALVHPETAKKLGVADKSALTLTTASGNLTVGVEISPTVRPDVIAVPVGNGHSEAAGRYARYGANPISLLTLVKDPHGCMAWQQGKVTAAAAGSAYDLVSTFGGDSDLDRKFVALASAKQLAEQGDVDTGHSTLTVGSSVLDVHEAPWDPRLTKAGITDFYPAPDHPNYRFGMAIDTNTCTGCGACAVACYAENNLAVVGKAKMREGREMGWLRVNRYWKPELADDGSVIKEQAYFVPMMCQHCAHAPCESVCPVLATYHTVDGLNAMVYNRCVGTRYCSNACPYSARRFNYHSYQWPEPFNLMLNPDVSTRTMGVMEKCTFCVQRIRRTKIAWKDRGHTDLVPDEQWVRLTACADACPSNAIAFGNLNDPNSTVSKARRSGRSYYPIFEINTMPAVSYLARATHHREPAAHHGAGHAGAGDPSHPAPSAIDANEPAPAHTPAGH